MGDPGNTFDVADLVDQKCCVMIAHTTTDAGDVWENVESVKKPKPMKLDFTPDDMRVKP